MPYTAAGLGLHRPWCCVFDRREPARDARKIYGVGRRCATWDGRFDSWSLRMDRPGLVLGSRTPPLSSPTGDAKRAIISQSLVQPEGMAFLHGNFPPNKPRAEYAVHACLHDRISPPSKKQKRSRQKLLHRMKGDRNLESSPVLLLRLLCRIGTHPRVGPELRRLGISRHHRGRRRGL